MQNNPVNANDPTGHYCVGDMEGCQDGGGGTGPQQPGYQNENYCDTHPWACPREDGTKKPDKELQFNPDKNGCYDTNGNGYVDVPCATFPPLALGKLLLCTPEMGLTLTECYYARGLLASGESLIVDETQFGDMVLAIYYDIVQRSPNGPLMLQKMSLDTPFFNQYGSFTGGGCLDSNFCGNRSEINYVEQGIIAAHSGQSFEEGIATINTWKKYTHRALQGITTGNWEPFQHGPYATNQTYQWYAYGYNAYINISGEEWLR